MLTHCNFFLQMIIKTLVEQLVRKRTLVNYIHKFKEQALER